MLTLQNDLFIPLSTETENRDPAFVPDLNSYDTIIIATSFGKDSLSAYLRLIELGADNSRIEWWHHDIDDSTRPRDSHQNQHFMAWPFEQAYGRALARHFNVPLYLSAKEGGFEREMLRENAPTAATWYDTPDGILRSGGISRNTDTRRKFPQVSADLRTRWCSPYLKIMVADAALNNQPRFRNSRTLFVTGERGEESPGRARYTPFAPHRSDRRKGKQNRHIDHWMPVHAWTEAEVWDIIRRHGIVPAIPYQIGFSRFSCAGCIFGSPDHFATIRLIHPQLFDRLTSHEQNFGCTIKRDIDLITLASRGKPFQAAIDNPDLCAQALDPNWNHPVFTPNWTMPAGAFKHSGGPS